MATACPNQFSLGRCVILHQGWLNGTHPKVGDSEVIRQVCLSYTVCCSQTVDIKVENCASYYVYSLRPPPACPNRYCGADWTKLKQQNLFTTQFSLPSPHLLPVATRVLIWLNVEQGYDTVNFTSWSASRQQAWNCFSEYCSTVTNWCYRLIGERPEIKEH